MSAPGPFSRQGFCLLGRINDTEWLEIAEFTPRIEDSYRADLVSLLNKGTHFEAMREALEEIDKILADPPKSAWTKIDTARAFARAALAAAAGEKDDAD